MEFLGETISVSLGKVEKEQIKIDIRNAKKKSISSGVLSFDLNSLLQGVEQTAWEQLSGKALINIGLKAEDFGKEVDLNSSKYPPIPAKEDLDLLFEKFVVIYISLI